MIRYLLFLIMFIVFTTGHTACHHDPGEEETPDNVVEVLSEKEKTELANEWTSLEDLLQRPLDKRAEEAAEYMQTYIELREKDPAEASKALRTAFYIVAKREHPLMEEWLTLVPRIIGVEEGLLTDLQRLNEIELQIARENKEDPQYIKVLEKQAEEYKTEIEDLRAQGVDPAKFKVSFKIDEEE